MAEAKPTEHTFARGVSVRGPSKRFNLRDDQSLYFTEGGRYPLTGGQVEALEKHNPGCLVKPKAAAKPAEG